MKDETKEVALGTSKINYMDPRITIAWCKEKEVPVEKVFAKSVLEKFPWAMEVPPTWRFNSTTTCPPSLQKETSTSSTAQAAAAAQAVLEEEEEENQDDED